MKLLVDYATKPSFLEEKKSDHRSPYSGQVELDLDMAVLKQTPGNGLPSAEVEHEYIKEIKKMDPNLIMADAWMLNAMLMLQMSTFSGNMFLLLKQDPSDTREEKGSLIFFPGSFATEILEISVEVHEERKPGVRQRTEKVFKKANQERRFVYGFGALRCKSGNDVTGHNLCRWNHCVYEKTPPKFEPLHIGAFGPNVWWLFFPSRALVPIN